MEIVKMVYDEYFVCQAHIPRKTIKTSGDTFQLCDEPFEQLQRDVIQLPPSVGLFVLEIVYIL
jgi:hypothetical protein